MQVGCRRSKYANIVDDAPLAPRPVLQCLNHTLPSEHRMRYAVYRQPLCTHTHTHQSSVALTRWGPWLIPRRCAVGVFIFLCLLRSLLLPNVYECLLFGFVFVIFFFPVIVPACVWLQVPRVCLPSTGESFACVWVQNLGAHHRVRATHAMSTALK